MSKEKISICFVEDDNYIANMYKTILVKSGYDVIRCEDGDEVLDKIKVNKPDFIILDFILPKKNGLEVLKIIKSDKELMKIPVLMFSNTGRKEDVQKCLELGALEYLSKSGTLPAELVKIIEKYIPVKP